MPEMDSSRDNFSRRCVYCVGTFYTLSSMPTVSLTHLNLFSKSVQVIEVWSIPSAYPRLTVLLK